MQKKVGKKNVEKKVENMLKIAYFQHFLTIFNNFSTFFSTYFFQLFFAFLKFPVNAL